MFSDLLFDKLGAEKGFSGSVCEKLLLALDLDCETQHCVFELQVESCHQNGPGEENL